MHGICRSKIRQHEFCECKSLWAWTAVDAEELVQLGPQARGAPQFSINMRRKLQRLISWLQEARACAELCICLLNLSSMKASCVEHVCKM